MAYATYYPQVMASGAFLVQVDGNGNFGTYYNGTEIGFTTQAGAESINGALTVQANATYANNQVYLAANSGGYTIIKTDSAGNLYIYPPNGSDTINLEGGSIGIIGYVSSVKGASTAGPLGIGAIYGATSPTHKTNAAPASTTYASPAAGFYVIKVSMDVKTATTLTGKFKATYTDSEGTAQTDALVFVQEGTATAVTSITTADRFSCVYTICTSGATNIVVTDNSGTYTTCDYYYAVTITQEA